MIKTVFLLLLALAGCGNVHTADLDANTFLKDIQIEEALIWKPDATLVYLKGGRSAASAQAIASIAEGRAESPLAADPPGRVSYRRA